MAAILAVEDDPVHLTLLETMLQKLGHQPLTAPSGPDAWSTLLANPWIELVILDLDLGSSSGLDFLRQVRAHPLFQSLAIVVLTGQRDRDTVLQVLQLKVASFDLKPLRLERLRKLLEGLECTPPAARCFQRFEAVTALTQLPRDQYTARLLALAGQIADFHQSLADSPSRAFDPALDRFLDFLQAESFQLGFPELQKAVDTFQTARRSQDPATIEPCLPTWALLPRLLHGWLARQPRAAS